MNISNRRKPLVNVLRSSYCSHKENIGFRPHFEKKWIIVLVITPLRHHSFILPQTAYFSLLHFKSASFTCITAEENRSIWLSRHKIIRFWYLHLSEHEDDMPFLESRVRQILIFPHSPCDGRHHCEIPICQNFPKSFRFWNRNQMFKSDFTETIDFRVRSRNRAIFPPKVQIFVQIFVSSLAELFTMLATSPFWCCAAR